MHYKKLAQAINLEMNDVLSDSFPRTPYGVEHLARYKAALENKNPDDIFNYVRSMVVRVGINRSRLEAAIDSNKTRLETMRPISLYDADLLNGKLQLKDKKLPLHEIIIQLFNSFANLSTKHGYTAASHILNVLVPDFFLDWEGAVREAYGCSPNAEGYFNFIFRMQRELKDLINSYLQDYPHITHKDAIRQIQERFFTGGWVPITRLMDMHNYLKYRKERIDC